MSNIKKKPTIMSYTISFWNGNPHQSAARTAFADGTIRSTLQVAQEYLSEAEYEYNSTITKHYTDHRHRYCEFQQELWQWMPEGDHVHPFATINHPEAEQEDEED